MEEEKQSSEVKDQEVEKSAAEEALDATAGPASETESKEKTVPLHDHTALRKRAQTAERAQAFAEGQLAAINQAAKTQTPAVKSPMELEIERQTAEGIDQADQTFTPAIMQAELDYRDQVANQAVADKATAELHAKQVASTTTAKAKHEDWQTVVSTAYALMTPGEIVDIERESVNFGEVAYAKAQEAITRNAPESKTKTAPEKKQSGSEAEVKTEVKVQTQDEILAEVQADDATARAVNL